MNLADTQTQASLNQKYSILTGNSFTNLPYAIPYKPIWMVTDISIPRYFTKKINDSTIVEINDTNYSALVASNMYNCVMLDWKIRGSKDTVTDSSGIVAIGVSEYNTKQIQSGNSILSGLSRKLINTLEFYQGI